MDYIWRVIGLLRSPVNNVQQPTRGIKQAHGPPFFLARPLRPLPGEDYLDTLNNLELLESRDDHWLCSLCNAFLVHKFALPQHMKDKHSEEIPLTGSKHRARRIDPSSRAAFKKSKAPCLIITRSRSCANTPSSAPHIHRSRRSTATSTNASTNASFRRGRISARPNSTPTAATPKTISASTTTITTAEAPASALLVPALSTPGPNPAELGTATVKVPYVRDELSPSSEAAVAAPFLPPVSLPSRHSIPNELCFLCHQKFFDLDALKQHINEAHSNGTNEVDRTNRRSNDKPTRTRTRLRRSATVTTRTATRATTVVNTRTILTRARLLEKKRA